MLVAADYPLLDLVGTIVIFVFFLIWVWLVIKVLAVLIFRRHDLSVSVKACWLVFVMLVPFVGVFVYLITENKRTGRQNSEQATA